MRHLASRLCLAVLLLTACTGPAATPSPSQSPSNWVSQGAGDLVPIVVSTELAVGSNRFLLNLVDRQNEPLAAPDRAATLNFYDLTTNATTPLVSVAGTYMVVLESLPGLYRAQVEFGRAGQWGLEVVTDEPDGSQRSGRLSFPVRDETTTPALGADAPPSTTPTAATADEISAISTDEDPDADFYRLSVDQALAGGRPFMLVFATPAFCASATCGPALDIVKSVAPEFKADVDFIHVEPYQLQATDSGLQPVLDANNRPMPVESVLEWGLPTEPYAFVIDGQGKVTAKFEGVAGADEIRQALTAVAP